MDALATDLLGGPVPREAILASLEDVHDIAIRDGFAFLRGYADLVERSKRRVAAHRAHNGWARAVAENYARDLFRICPLIDSISLSGSVASGGYDANDDIDFDLFVIDDTKYLVYALALLLGLRVSFRYRHLGGLRKIICINVLWTQAESMPFRRRDEDLAFELLHCQPIIGSAHFAGVIAANSWVLTYFPQLKGDQTPEVPRPSLNVIGRFVQWLVKHPRLLHAANQTSRVSTHTVYSIAHLLKRKDPEEMARLRFLHRVKFPYEVFQD